MPPSRRSFCRTLGRGLVFGLGTPFANAWTGPELSIDRLRECPDGRTTSAARSYRAHVVVALMGVPIFSRQDAGYANALLRETVSDGRRTFALRFSGGSRPERTHGVDYCGSMDEIAVERGSALAEAASFGFVTTTSSDESYDQARHRVLNSGGKSRSFVAVDASHRSAKVHIRKAYLSAPGSGGDMAGRVRSEFSNAALIERDAGFAASEVPATFLYTVLCAARAAGQHSTLEYVHNGDRYRLDSQKTSEPGGGTRLVAQIREIETKKTCTFRLWLEQGSDLPVRIEFSPRSYLRITLESETLRTANPKEDM
jgi:hypothetical protein